MRLCSLGLYPCLLALPSRWPLIPVPGRWGGRGTRDRMESPLGLLGDCLASWPHAGKKRRKQSGPSREWGPAVPSSPLHTRRINKANCRRSRSPWIPGPLHHSLSYQQFPPNSMGTDSQPRLTSWAEEPLRCIPAFLAVTTYCDMVANSELAMNNTGCTSSLWNKQVTKSD